MHFLRCMGSKFCVKFQRAPLKFHTKFWTHTPQNMNFTVFYFCVWVTISLNCDVISLSETGPCPVMPLIPSCRYICLETHGTAMLDYLGSIDKDLQKDYFAYSITVISASQARRLLSVLVHRHSVECKYLIPVSFALLFQHRHGWNRNILDLILIKIFQVISIHIVKTIRPSSCFIMLLISLIDKHHFIEAEYIFAS